MQDLLQVVDPRRASYGVEHATYAVMQLAQTTMRSELGKITLDKTFEERDALNRNIVTSIQCAPATRACKFAAAVMMTCRPAYSQGFGHLDLT